MVLCVCFCCHCIFDVIGRCYQAELKSDDPLSTSQLATKVAQVSTKRNILAVLEQAAAVAGGGGGAEGSEGTMNEEGLLEID